MIKIYLINDTGKSRHAGCKAVMRSIRAELSFADIIATHTVGSTIIDAQALADCDAVVVNGEGTIHHDSSRANFLLLILTIAQAAGKKTALINAVYQQEILYYRDTLERLDLLIVREVRSAAAARAHGGCPCVRMDSASDKQQLQSGKPLKQLSGIIKGATHPKAQSAGWLDSLNVPSIDLSSGTLDDIIATIRQADVYVTGQHHGIYAAALAGVPFVAIGSNSHKIEGLIEWSGLPIPVITQADRIEAAIRYAKSNRGLFEEFSAFVASHDVFRASMLEKCFT